MKNNKPILRGMVVSLAIAARLMNPVSVHAGGGMPPRSSETPAATSTAEPAQVIPTESPTPEPTQLVPNKPGIDRIPTKLVPPNPMDTSTPTPPSDPTEPPVESATSTPDPTGEVEKPTLTDVLQELQGDTSVVVLDENGQPLPLVSQTTADIVAQGDPMWCPEGIAPGGAGCTSAYATLTDLLSNAGTYINSQNVNGVIWITGGAVADTNPITIDGATYTNWSNYNLTLQGGWSGINGDTTIGANSVFYVPVTITSWNNNVAIQNISVDLKSVTAPQGNGISITNVNGDVSLDNVRVDRTAGPTGGGIYIDSPTNSEIVIDQVTIAGASGFGLGIITAGGNVTINNSHFANTLNGYTHPEFYWGDGVDIYNYGGNITIAQSYFTGNAFGLYAPYAGNISIDHSEFNGNLGWGLYGYSSGNITLDNVTANNNYAGISIGAPGAVSLNDVTVWNNGGTGLQIHWARDVALTNVIANGNGIGAWIAYVGNVNFSGGAFTNNVTGLCLIAVNSFNFDDPSSTIFMNNGIDMATGDYCSDPINPPQPKPITFLQSQGELFALDCISAQHRYVVRLANGDRGEIYCPVTGKASIDRVDNTTLPTTLPAGYMYASAFDVKILQNDRPIFVIAEEGYITASFLAQQSEAGNAYSILYWDDQNKTWIPLKDLLLDAKGEPETFPLYPDDAEDTRKILSGVNLVTKNGETRVEVSTNFPGIFVLAQH